MNDNYYKIEHPGKLIQKILTANHMSQKELALRTGVTEKHISTVISGSKNISLDFSKKLEYVFNYVAPGYFYNCQLEYDKMTQKKEEENGITENEKDIFKQLKEPIDYVIKRGNEFIDESMSEVEKIIGIRRFLKVSSLELIPSTTSNTAFRKNKNVTVNQYILSMWIQICDYYTSKMKNDNSLNLDLLRKKISDIKKLMNANLDINLTKAKLQSILIECGISFDIVQNFKGAPVQGFIKLEENKHMLMCVTIRGKRFDSFWFTIFHEIGHIVNENVEGTKIDTFGENDKKETKADEFASNIIMDKEDYQTFINRGDYSLQSIKEFSATQNIPHYMTIGRMQKDHIIEYHQYYGEIPLLEWEK